MEKLRLNNKIVSMRPAVKKAQVHVAHKLTREINKLKNRKGNEKQVEKSKRKAERLKGELDNIKKIKKDDVSKFAIKNTRTLEEILLNPQSTCFERAIGRLACHPDMMARVEQLRSEPIDWASHLDDLGSRTREKKKKKKKELKKPKISQIFEPGHFVKIRHASSNDDFTSDLMHDVGRERVDDARENPHIRNHGKMPHLVFSGENMEKCERQTSNFVSLMCSTEQRSDNNRSLGDAKNVTLGSDTNVSESSDENSDHSSLREQTDKFSSSEKPKSLQPDPFFLTDEGEYLSSIVKSDSLGDDKDTVEKHGIYNTSAKGNLRMRKSAKAIDDFKNVTGITDNLRHNFRNMNKETTAGTAKERKFVHRDNFKEKKAATRSMQIRNKNMNLKDNQSVTEISLHPSWEAKKKMQLQQLNIHAFQGKKIKFDDDE